MRYVTVLTVLFLLLAASLAAAAEAPSVVICILEKNHSELQGVSIGKTAVAGALLKAGWNVLDINAYPVTLAGEDLGAYLAQHGAKASEYKSKDLNASIGADGSVRLITKDVYSLNQADLRHLNWRLDAEKLQDQARAAGARYVLYGEITAKALPKGSVPEGFASEGYSSVIALANLRLVDTGTRAVTAVFAEQAPGLQLTREAAELLAIKNVALKAGEYFAKQIAEPAGAAGR